MKDRSRKVCGRMVRDGNAVTGCSSSMGPDILEEVRRKLRADILAALSRVYAEDAELLSDNIDVCERSLLHRFTHYFMEYVESGKDAFYEGLHVDGEYNRQGRDGCPKLRNGKPIYPDVIVHTRGDNKCNLCVIEFKKANNEASLKAQGFKEDVEKLKFLTGEACKFRYDWGVHVFFMVSSMSKGFRGVRMEWYKDGKQFGSVEKESLPLQRRIEIDPDVDAAWGTVARRRMRELRSGKVHGIPVSAVFARARKIRKA